MKSSRLSVAQFGAPCGTLALLTFLTAGTLSVSNAVAQSESTVASSGVPQRDTLQRLLKPVTVEFKEHRLEEVVRFVAELTGAEIEPMWLDDTNPQGLDKDKQITLKANGVTALRLLERVLEKSTEDGSSKTNTWQMTEGGAIQIGPKVRLNVDKRLEIYDIADLLLVVPEFANAPKFDLQSVLSSGSGGGGGQSPFQDNQNTGQQGNVTTIGNADILPKKDRAEDLVKIIEEYVETEQWLSQGGSGGSIKYYPPGSLIINAADYLHRQINGYRYWPQRLTSGSIVAGQRYVSLNSSNTINKLDGFTNQPITATAGGPPGGGGKPGGGR